MTIDKQPKRTAPNEDDVLRRLMATPPDPRKKAALPVKKVKKRAK